MHYEATFFLMMHSTHFIYGHMVWNTGLRNTQIKREETTSWATLSDYCKISVIRKEGNVLFNDVLNNFIYGYMASDI